MKSLLSSSRARSSVRLRNAYTTRPRTSRPRSRSRAREPRSPAAASSPRGFRAPAPTRPAPPARSRPEPGSCDTASFAWRIFPSRSATNTGSGAFSMMMSAARALCGAAPSPSTSAVSVRLNSFLATVRPPFSSERLGTRPFRFICLLETLPAIPRERERLGSRRDATSPSRCRRDVDPGGPGACAPDLGLRRQRLRLERPRLRTGRVRRQPVRRRRRPLVESALGRNRRDDRRRPRRARRHRRDHGRNLLMPNEEGLAELHTHLGGSVATEIMWTLAHEQGIALPVKDYWEFDELVTVSDARGVADLTALDQIYKWTELIQSSPLAVERSVHAAIGGAYRSQRITTLELRFNPMKRNRGGERDLDHIIMAAIRGLDRASLEYPQVCAGLILMMDRTFDARLNEIIVEKAIKWAPRGVVGVDIAGPRPSGGRYDYGEVAPMVETAREAGLGVTIHVGEEGGDMGREEIVQVVELLRPDRIGHGILAAADAELMRELRDARIVLEICPTSNLLTKALPDEEAVRATFRAFAGAGVQFTIATDGPEMMRTHLRDEFDLLLRVGALNEDELRAANQRAHESSFLRPHAALRV